MSATQRQHLRCTSDALTLGTLNFSHFSHFLSATIQIANIRIKLPLCNFNSRRERV